MLPAGRHYGVLPIPSAALQAESLKHLSARLHRVFRKVGGGVAVKVFKHETKAITPQFIPYEVRYGEMSDDEDAALEADEPRVIGIMLLERCGDFFGFLEVMGFVRLAGFYQADLAHVCVSRALMDDGIQMR